MVPSRWVGARLQDADHKYTDGAVRASLNRLHAGVSGEAHQRERLCRYIARAAVAEPPLAGRGDASGQGPEEGEGSRTACRYRLEFRELPIAFFERTTREVPRIERLDHRLQLFQPILDRRVRAREHRE